MFSTSQMFLIMTFGSPERLSLEKHNYTHTWKSESDIGLPLLKPDVLEYSRE